MSFEDELKNFVSKIPEKEKYIDSEAATKIALINPFLRLMGYDTTDPTVVKPEFTADIGGKKGEKVDLACLNEEGEVEILIECKPANSSLNTEHISQLYRYFNITPCKIGILTNGLQYHFFTDSREKSRMDEKPFLEINMKELNQKDITELEKFKKEKFNLELILARVELLKYSNAIKKTLLVEIESPSDELVRAISKQVFDGILTKNKVDMFQKIIKNSFKEIINDKIDKRLTDAIKPHENDVLEKTPEETTRTEVLEAFSIIKSIASEIIDNSRLQVQNRKYGSVINLDHYQKPICRLYFNNPRQKRIGLFDNFKTNKRGSKKDYRVQIDQVADIYKYKENIKKTIRKYDKKKIQSQKK